MDQSILLGLRLWHQLQNGDQRDSNARRQDRTEQNQRTEGDSPVIALVFHPPDSLTPLLLPFSPYTSPSPLSLSSTLSTPPFHSVSFPLASLWIPAFPPASREGGTDATAGVATPRAPAPIPCVVYGGGHFQFKNGLETQVGGSSLLGTLPLARVMTNISCHKELESLCP